MKFGKRKNTIAEISRRLGFPYTTVRSALQRFESAGYVWKQTRKGPPFKSIPTNVQETLLSKDWLRQNAHFSLKERVMIIERDFDIKMSYSCLRLFYHRNNVKFRRAHWKYR